MSLLPRINDSCYCISSRHNAWLQLISGHGQRPHSREVYCIAFHLLPEVHLLFIFIFYTIMCCETNHVFSFLLNTDRPASAWLSLPGISYTRTFVETNQEWTSMASVQRIKTNSGIHQNLSLGLPSLRWTYQNIKTFSETSVSSLVSIAHENKEDNENKYNRNITHHGFDMKRNLPYVQGECSKIRDRISNQDKWIFTTGFRISFMDLPQTEDLWNDRLWLQPFFPWLPQDCFLQANTLFSVETGFARSQC